MKAKPIQFKLRNLTEAQAKRLSLILIPALLVLIVILAIFPLNTAAPYEATTYAMGSYVQQTVYGAQCEEAASSAASAVQMLENEISWRVDGSETQAINENAGLDWIEVSAETVELLALCQDVSEKSGGAFDVTVAPLSWLWAFDDAPTAPPNDTLITALLPNIGSAFLRIDAAENTVSLRNRGNAIDLGAVGKGAACDAAVAAYAEAGADAAVVSVGGSVGTFGKKPGGAPWNIAVRDPENTGSLGTLSIAEGFLSTSGSYEKTFTADGVTYHHLLDPATGYPAESGLVSVTVLSARGALSDALSTACFVLGLEEGTALLEAYGASGIFIDDAHQITVVGSLDFTLTADSYTVLTA